MVWWHCTFAQLRTFEGTLHHNSDDATTQNVLCLVDYYHSMVRADILVKQLTALNTVLPLKMH